LIKVGLKGVRPNQKVCYQVCGRGNPPNALAEFRGGGPCRAHAFEPARFGTEHENRWGQREEIATEKFFTVAAVRIFTAASVKGTVAGIALLRKA
jgi:hypothetical protein